MNLKKSIIILFILLNSLQTFSQNKTEDARFFIIPPASLKTIDDNFYKDFTLVSDSSCFEIINNGKLISVIPIKLFQFLNFHEFDSIKSEIKPIRTNQKKLVIQCFTGNLKLEGRELIELLLGGLKK
jgi:hypothetical protein